jgi:two-component system, LytTR family, sensor kinase
MKCGFASIRGTKAVGKFTKAQYRVAMDRLRYNPGDRHLNWQIALFSILGFWLLYVLIVTLRAYVVDFPAQGEMAIRRGAVTALGILITILLWQILRRFDQKTLGFRIAAAAVLAVPAAMLISSANYFIFHIFEPSINFEIDREIPGVAAEPSMGMVIVEVAIDRYFFLIAWCAVYLALGFAGDVGRAERRAADFARAAQAAELRALRYQVNPHFLFNTLNSLSALVMRGRRDEAEAMIMNLSTFYRTSLADDPGEDVPLRDEIALQRLYLDIEMIRFPERLSVAVDLPDDLTGVAVPSLILQPLVENAIKHGVSQTTKSVTIGISAWREGGTIILSVRDNGRAKTKSPSENGHGIGLVNVRDRLAARFGDAARLETCADDKGFVVTLRLPVDGHNG